MQIMSRGLGRIVGEFMESYEITTEYDTSEHAKGGHFRDENKEDRTGQREPEQQQAAEQRNKTQRRPEEATKTGNINF